MAKNGRKNGGDPRVPVKPRQRVALEALARPGEWWRVRDGTAPGPVIEEDRARMAKLAPLAGPAGYELASHYCHVRESAHLEAALRHGGEPRLLLFAANAIEPPQFPQESYATASWVLHWADEHVRRGSERKQTIVPEVVAVRNAVRSYMGALEKTHPDVQPKPAQRATA